MAQSQLGENDGTAADGGDSGLVRIRVRARSAGGPAVPMVGILPRSTIDALRREVRALAASTGRRPELAARVAAIESVQVSCDGRSQPVPARRVHLELSVKPGPAKASDRSRRLQRDIERLKRAAERARAVEHAPA